MIHCHRCKTVNPPEQRHCQKCHRDLLPGEGALTRLTILITAGLLTALGVWVLVRMFQGDPPPILNTPKLDWAFNTPVFWAILVIVTPISALKLALMPTPAHQKYLNRAKRHLSLDKAQALADLNQALELAPEKERTAILKERASLYESLGQKQQAVRDEIARIESNGAYESAEGIAALTGMDRDIFAGGIKDNDIQALLKAQAAVPLGYCPKCKNVVELNEKMRCRLHRRARIESVRLAVPEDIDKIKEALLESHTRATRLNRSRQLLLVLTAVLAIVAWAYVLNLGPFAHSSVEPASSLVEPAAELALPVVAVEDQTQPTAQSLPAKVFDEHDFSFELPGDWLVITEQDHRELLNGSLTGMDTRALQYLGGAYTGGLNNCAGCAQIVILVMDEPAMTGEFSEGQFQIIKENQQASMGERLLSYTYVHVDGFPAAESQHIGRSGETRLWEYIIVPTTPGVVYLFSMSASRDEYLDFEPVFEQAAATLRIRSEP